MINTKEINELMYAMHDPINAPPKSPLWRVFRIGIDDEVNRYECPNCNKPLYAWRARPYRSKFLGCDRETLISKNTSVDYYGTKLSQCPECGQSIDWRLIV